MIRAARSSRRTGCDRLLPMLIVGNGIIGGMEEYVLTLVRQFREAGRRALVAAPFVGEFTAALLEQGHPAGDLHILDMSDRIDVGALAQLITFLRARGVDVVHTHLLPADALGAAAAAQAGIPALSTLHGLARCKEELLLRDLFGLEYVAVSEAGRASAIANGLPSEAVSTILNGVDPRRFDPTRFDRQAVRRSLGVELGQVLVTSVSRLSREKYPEGFLEVAEIASRRDPRLVFALVGTGPLESKLRQMAAGSTARARIHLLGGRRDVPELLAASDVAALTSRTESLPFFVLEAMSMQLPVVAHEVGGVGEALEDGAEGFLVPFGHPGTFAARITALAADAALRRRMGLGGREKVLDRFDFRRTAAALLDLYARLVERHGLSSPTSPCTEFAQSGSGDGNGKTGAAAGLRPPALPGARRGPEGARPRRPQLAAVDAHLHLTGGESCDQVLETLDAAGVAHACLIAPFLDCGSWVPAAGKALAPANDALLDLVSRAPERFWGLVGVNPRESEAPRLVKQYAAAKGVGGVKMIPHGWRPDGAVALDVYEACEEAGLPILFHSGIFIGGRSSNACRPALYEVVRRFPRLRVVLAHAGWPWTDEAIAVAFMDLLKGAQPQIVLDVSPGTPPVYRRQALRRAYAVLGSAALIFGSDRFLPTEPGAIAERLTEDLRIFRALGAGAEDLSRIFNGNASGLFARKAGLDPEAAFPASPAAAAGAGASISRMTGARACGES